MKSSALTGIPVPSIEYLWMKRIAVSFICIILFASVGATSDSIASGSSVAKYIYFDFTVAFTLVVITIYLLTQKKPAHISIDLTDILLFTFTGYLLFEHIVFERRVGFHAVNCIALFAGYILLKKVLQKVILMFIYK